jgi:hypothetical protein
VLWKKPVSIASLLSMMEAVVRAMVVMVKVEVVMMTMMK